MSRVHTCPAADLRHGHTLRDGAHLCLFCEARFETGQVFPEDGVFRVASAAADHHVATAHGGPLAALLALGRTGHGLSEVQAEVVALQARGLDDKAMAAALGGRSVSTVRNHRFQLRRRHREARVFSALMALLEAGARLPAPDDAPAPVAPAPAADPPPPAARFVEFHAELPTTDERTAITVAEAEKLRQKYFSGPDQRALQRIPKKEKHKLVVLQRVVEALKPGERYTEREVNALLAEIHSDTAALRRYLVDYRFVARTPDGAAYWRTDGDR